MPTTRERPHYPMFEEYALDDLMERTGYAYLTLLDIKDGRKPANRRFRINIANALRRSQDNLFGKVMSDK